MSAIDSTNKPVIFREKLWRMLRSRARFLSEPLSLHVLKRPSRTLMWKVIRYHNMIVRVLLCLLLIAALPFKGWPAYAVVGGYLISSFAFSAFKRKNWEQYQKHNFVLIRGIVNVIGISALILAQEILVEKSDRVFGDLLWPLYLLAILSVAQSSETKQVVVTLVLSIMAVVTTLSLGYLADPDRNLYTFETMIRKVVIESAWIGLLGLTLLILVRYALEMLANERLITSLQRAFLTHAEGESEQQFLNRACDVIADSVDLKYVNIFERDDSGLLRCIGASGSRANTLVGKLVMDPSRGIVGRAALGTEGYFVSNDVRFSKDYFPHNEFPDTRSELAVRFSADTEPVLVLDLQATRTNYFFVIDPEHDIPLFRSASNALGAQIASLRRTATEARLQRLATKMTEAFAAAETSKSHLRTIADTAKETFGADIVTVHERNRHTGATKLKYVSGEPENESALERIDRPDNLVARLLAISPKEQVSRFQRSVVNMETLPLFSLRATDANAPESFAMKEGIKSRAILYLGKGNDCVGVLFVNFKTSRDFPKKTQGTYHVFAHLATLAIQNAQRVSSEQQKRQEELRSNIHDGIITHGFYIDQYLNRLLESDQLDKESHGLCFFIKKHLDQVRDNARLLHVLHSSDGMEARPKATTLRREILEVVDEIKHLIRIRKKDTVVPDITPMLDACPDNAPTEYTFHIRLIVRELLLNACKHSKGDTVQLGVTSFENHLVIEASDNGIGFDQQATQHGGGLSAIKYRTACLNGHGPYICGNEPSGTTVRVKVPMPGAEGVTR
jgi:hypothetical protein